MAKIKQLFECQSCGFQQTKWMGKCPNCNTWDSFLELNQEQVNYLKEIKTPSSNSKSLAIPITKVEAQDVQRFSSQSNELDLVLGGGIVPGSLILVGGSPGVGKSTLLLKISGSLAQNNKKVLYVSGEESPSQIKMRSDRLESSSDNLFLLSEIKLNTILDEIRKNNYHVLVIDSIQTIYSENLTAAPGSISQVKEITFELMRFAKINSIAIFIIGHITKDGSIAGPRILEHMVDVVLYFEGDTNRELRLLRGFKNRFGSTSEIGIFEMTKKGLVSASEASKKFFTKGVPQSGSATTVTMEGSRALVIEVQALVSQSSYPSPKRSATGFDLNRLNMLLALLEKKLDLPFNQYDVFINISGGIKISEPAADLAIIAAILSSYKNRPINKNSIFIGEVSLIGDIRDVFNLDLRLREAKNQNFTNAVLPSSSLEKTNIKCFIVKEVTQILDWM